MSHHYFGVNNQFFNFLRHRADLQGPPINGKTEEPGPVRTAVPVSGRALMSCSNAPTGDQQTTAGPSSFCFPETRREILQARENSENIS